MSKYASLKVLTYSQQAYSMTRRDLLKTGLTTGAGLFAWSPRRPPALWGAQGWSIHPIRGNPGWESAIERMKHGVHAVISKGIFKGRPAWMTLGTAFLISLDPHPTLTTNAHVVADITLSIRQELALGVFAYPSAAAAGLRVRMLEPGLDLAILDASPEAAIGKVMTFSDKAPLPAGTAIASLGFPIPQAPVLTETGGRLSINLRLATGFTSSPDYRGLFFQDAPWTTPDLQHYELNMLSYGGISGGPLFNLDGKIIGVVRGGLQYNQQVAAYTYSLRNGEVLEFLESKGVPYEKA
jgi:S1-C subfamily serine protease